MGVEQTLGLLEGVDTAVLDLEARGVFVRFRPGKFPGVPSIRDAIKESGFELTRFEVEIRGAAPRSPIGVKELAGGQGLIVLRDPRKVIEASGASLREAFAITLRGVVDNNTTQTLTVDICALEIAASDGEAPNGLTLPLCP